VRSRSISPQQSRRKRPRSPKRWCRASRGELFTTKRPGPVRAPAAGSDPATKWRSRNGPRARRRSSGTKRAAHRRRRERVGQPRPRTTTRRPQRPPPAQSRTLHAGGRQTNRKNSVRLSPRAS
jgi:hypothetical protein